MKKTFPLALFTAALVACALALGAPVPLHAHDGHGGFSAGEPGNPKKPFRIVTVTMRDDNGAMAFEPSKLEVKRGEQIKFVIVNSGVLAHEFVLANEKDNLKHAALMQKFPDMEHDDPNAKTVQPQAKSEILWRFSKRGTFEFACLIPGHRQAGMIGTVIVK